MVIGLGVQAFSKFFADEEYRPHQINSALDDLGRRKGLGKWSIDPYKNGNRYSYHLRDYGDNAETIKIVKEVCCELITKKLKESA